MELGVSWSTFLTTPANAPAALAAIEQQQQMNQNTTGGGHTAHTQLPPYHQHASMIQSTSGVPQHSSIPFATHSLNPAGKQKALARNRAASMQQLSSHGGNGKEIGSGQTSLPPSPQTIRNSKRTREDDHESALDHDTLDDSSSMQMMDGHSVTPSPYLKRMTSIELEQKYEQDGTSGSDRPQSKKQRPLSINVEPHSASTSPFLGGHASLSSSLAASPSLYPKDGSTNFSQQFGHQSSTFSSVASSPAPMPQTGSIFAASFQSLTQTNNQPAVIAPPQRISPYTSQIDSISTSNQSAATSNSLQSFPFLSNCTNPSTESSTVQSLDGNPPTSVFSNFGATSFRPSSAPLHRPMQSILLQPQHQAQLWQLSCQSNSGGGAKDSTDAYLAPMDERDGDHTAISSPPSSPIDATSDLNYSNVQHPSTPSRQSTSSAYSMPGLQRARSLTNGGSGSSGSHHPLYPGQTSTSTMSIPSSLQSSHPTSPTAAHSCSGFSSARGGGAVNFRSNSPSMERMSVTTFQHRSSNPHLPQMTTTLSHQSSLHTPTSSPIYPSTAAQSLDFGLLPQAPAGVEIGLGILYMDHCAQSQQAPSPFMQMPLTHQIHHSSAEQFDTNISMMEE